MLTLLLLVALTQPQPLEGRATFYAPGRMAEVAANRGIARDGAAVYVALNDCRHLGRLVWLERAGQFIAGRVVDCCQAAHRAERERLGYVAEVSFRQARRWGMAGPVAIKIHFTYPGGTCENSQSLYRCY